MDSESKVKVYAKLLQVQQKLRVPKNRKNSFGDYMFRNAADILENAKPHLEEVKAIVLLSDSIESLGNEGRYYLRANATFVDTESGESVSVFGQAREEASKKGMDAAQLTGACSSYARKYALCGLFAIDDSRLDPDETNKHGQEDGENGSTSTPQPSQAKTQPRPTKPATARKSAISDDLREKATKAWKIFLGLDSVKSMDDNSRSTFFKTKLKASSGKDDPSKLTAKDWDKVINELDMLKVM